MWSSEKFKVPISKRILINLRNQDDAIASIFRKSSGMVTQPCFFPHISSKVETLLEIVPKALPAGSYGAGAATPSLSQAYLLHTES